MALLLSRGPEQLQQKKLPDIEELSQACVSPPKRIDTICRPFTTDSGISLLPYLDILSKFSRSSPNNFLLTRFVASSYHHHILL